VLPLVYPIKYTSPLSKMTTIFLSLAPVFVILSISVEGLFYVAYSVTLYLWVQVEAAYRNEKLKQEDAQSYRFALDDLRIVIFFLLFVQIGFFGTGK
jgi:GPI ethanolamine phosphate transferase 1